MDVWCQCLGDFVTPDVGNGVKGETVVDLAVALEVLPNGVDDQPKEVGVLMHEERDREIALQGDDELDVRLSWSIK